MTEILQPGRYPATPTGASSVYENAKGSLVLAMEFNVEGQNLKYLTALVTEANGVNTRNIDTLKTCFGWDGVDFFWFVEHPEAYTDREVEVTVEHNQGQNRVYANIAFIDPPGGGNQLPASGSKAALLAKYGSKFRAISGGAPSKPAAPAAKGPPAAPPTQPKLPLKPSKPDLKGTPSNQMACWQKLIEENQGKSEDDLTAIWFGIIGKLFPGVDQGDLTPMQWGSVFEALEDKVPF